MLVLTGKTFTNPSNLCCTLQEGSKKKKNFPATPNSFHCTK